MKHFVLMILAANLALASVGARSQLQFPEDSKAPDVAEIKKRLEDKVFNVALADGTSWRLEYKSNGYFFVNTSGGFKGSGQWQAEDGHLCGQLKGRERSCNEVRVHGEALLLKRDSGEIIRLARD